MHIHVQNRSRSMSVDTAIGLQTHQNSTQRPRSLSLGQLDAPKSTPIEKNLSNYINLVENKDCCIDSDQVDHQENIDNINMKSNKVDVTPDPIEIVVQPLDTDQLPLTDTDAPEIIFPEIQLTEAPPFWTFKNIAGIVVTAVLATCGVTLAFYSDPMHKR